MDGNNSPDYATLVTLYTDKKESHEYNQTKTSLPKRVLKQCKSCAHNPKKWIYVQPAKYSKRTPMWKERQKDVPYWSLLRPEAPIEVQPAHETFMLDIKDLIKQLERGYKNNRLQQTKLHGQTSIISIHLARYAAISCAWYDTQEGDYWPCSRGHLQQLL